ncbi:LicD family protein [Mediterraneibacter agrestimuris]|uniref:LicD family protein n=1 Tax=Mediterraneibacter agrestimuris TaxID=2941333 RepID=UPI00203D6D8C|nr:LicD family protein [Mediterraneibacter agrestimuris]
MKNIDQKQLLDNIYGLLSEFDRICRKYNLQYFLYAGTLLGAVREKNFIPWDDDVDIIMPRKDYEKLDGIIEKELDNRYVWDTMRKRAAFLNFLPSIKDKESPYQIGESSDFLCSEYAGIDIFIMDNAPQTKWGRIWWYIRLASFYGFGLAHRPVRKFMYPNNYSLFEYFVARTLQIFGRFTKLENILKKQKRYAEKYNRDGYHTNYIAITSQGPSRVSPFYLPKTIFESTVEFKIRERNFLCPAGWHELLTHMYGDYMTPPPEKERKNKHIPQ